MTSAGEDVENFEHWYTVGGNVNGAATLENSMVFRQKITNKITIWSTNSTSVVVV